MAEKRVSVLGDSAEAVAYVLLQCVAVSEGKRLNDGFVYADRKWILDTYAECLDAIRSPNGRERVTPQT